MGCGESKGKSAQEPEEKIEVVFKETGALSLDRFFESAKELTDNFKALREPLVEAKENFFFISKFYEVPGATVKHSFLGVFIALSAQINGQLDSIKTSWQASAPFIDLEFEQIK
jgi:hypothetical protein